MKYQIVIQEKETVCPKKSTVPILLKPQISIKGAAHWQKRIEKLLPDCHATVHVAK
jgi:hypothetical protein